MTSPSPVDDGRQGQVRPVTRLPVNREDPPVPVVTQARAAFTHARTAARAGWAARTQQHGGWVNGMIHWIPPSVAEQMEYARKALWVPPGHEGGLIERAGRRYQRRFGIPGVAVGNTISHISSRGIAAFITGILLTTFAVVITCTVVLHGHVALVLGGAVGAWALLLASLFVPSREERRSS